MDGWMFGWMDGWLVGRMDDWMDGWPPIQLFGDPFLRRIGKTAKETIFVVYVGSSVCPSACNISVPTGRILIEIRYLGVFRKSVEKIQVFFSVLQE